MSSFQGLPPECSHLLWKVTRTFSFTFSIYRVAEKSLARPGRKQARKYVRNARDFNNIETRAVIKFLSSCKARRRRKFAPFWQKISLFIWCVVDRASLFSMDKKNQLDVTSWILFFSSNSCSTCFGQPCAHHQELTTAWCYSLVLVCSVATGRLSSPVGR